MSTLERIETAGSDGKARRLVFDDGLDPRFTSAAAVRELGLEPNTILGRDAVEEGLRGVELRLAKERALSLLGYREHSAAELRRKLTDNGYPRSTVEAVVDRLVEIELVDDRRFACSWARSRVMSGYGARRIKHELAKRGINPDLVEEALDEVIDPDEEVHRARAALRGRTAQDRASRDRLLRRLVARGFSLQVALRALEAEEEPDVG